MITVVINGQNYNYPEVGDTDWGSIATLAFDAITKTTLQPVKDLNDPTAVNDFTLYNDIDFGPTHGLRVLFIQSRSNNPAASGVFRLAKDELVAWRNEDNDGDNTISFDSDGDLIVNGVKVTLHGQIVNADIAAAAGIEESKLALDYSTDSLHTAIENHVTDTNNPHSVTKSQVLTGDLIVNSDVDAAAAIEESKLNLDYSTDSLNTAITTHVSDTNNPHSVTKAQVLTGDLIVNADVDASAAIAESKLDLDYSTSSLNTAITSHTGNTSNPHSTTVANLTDTTITSAASGDVLSYDGSKWVNAPSSSASLSGLTDTDITTPADGDVLVYDSVSTKWENSDQLSTLDTTVSSHVGNTSNPHSTKVSNLDDASISSVADGDILVYDSNDSEWKNSDALSTLDSTVSSHVGNTSNPHSTTVSNLTDTTITSVSDKDTLLYDSNSSKWVNVENSLDNLSNTDIDSDTLTENDVVVFNDQTSKWENSQILVNHIGNAANPHLTTVSKLTDTTITTPSDKQLLQYDQANLQWVNSSDVWSTIEVNDIANINSSATAVTLTATDKRHQIFTATQGFDVTLPSTGVGAGEKFVFSFEPSSGDYYSTTSFCFKASDDSIINYAHNSKFEYIFTAKTNTPATSTDWFFSWSLVKRTTLEGHMDSTFPTTANNPTAQISADKFTIFAGYWNVNFSSGINAPLSTAENVYSGNVLIYNDGGPLSSISTSERIGIMQCISIPRTSTNSSSFNINGTSYGSRTMLPSSYSAIVEVPYRSKVTAFFSRLVTTTSTTNTIQCTATAVANLVAPYTTSI